MLEKEIQKKIKQSFNKRIGKGKLQTSHFELDVLDLMIRESGEYNPILKVGRVFQYASLLVLDSNHISVRDKESIFEELKDNYSTVIKLIFKSTKRDVIDMEVA